MCFALEAPTAYAHINRTMRLCSLALCVYESQLNLQYNFFQGELKNCVSEDLNFEKAMSRAGRSISQDKYLTKKNKEILNQQIHVQMENVS
jgi:hypothetical protein